MVISIDFVVEEKEVQCRFRCSSPAVARYYTPGGCVCFPGDKEQNLCAQHATNAEPLEGMYLIEIYQGWFFEKKPVVSQT